jgi:uncharacterized damage-inducible protein DinB
MTPAEVLADGFARVAEGVSDLLGTVSEDQLDVRIAADANSIGWIVWHLLRVQDDHVAEVAGTEQVWTGQGFARRFALPFDDAATGYGQSSEEVAQVRTTPALLAAYADAVAGATTTFVGSLSEADLDRVVDTRWDPPVTLGVRLVSVINDDTQHLGQATFLRGLL